MLAYVLSPEAVQDLEDIWDFIASDNIDAANRLENDCFEAFEELARHPQIGHVRHDLTKRNVRFWPVGSYLIVYRKARDTVQIVAVLHGARNIAKELRSR